MIGAESFLPHFRNCDRRVSAVRPEADEARKAAVTQAVLDARARCPERSLTESLGGRHTAAAANERSFMVDAFVRLQPEKQSPFTVDAANRTRLDFDTLLTEARIAVDSRRAV